MIASINNRIICLLLFIFTSVAYGVEDQSNRIEVLVNEDLITKYDIVQRMKINAILNRLEIDDNNYKQLLNTVVDDLIVEKLKKKKVFEYNIDINKEEFNLHEKRFYLNLNYEKEELKELFSLNDINYNYLLEYIEIELKWQKLIYGLYLRITSITDQEINNFISKNPDINKNVAKEILLQKQLDIKSTKLIKDLRDEATIEYK
tara:strand:+ start:223 stop:834 length:612 start_codon:yes stop_codon:yes gene_type:complete